MFKLAEKGSILLLFLVVTVDSVVNKKYRIRDRLERKLHLLKELNRIAIHNLSNKIQYEEFFVKHLEDLLRVRVPGTKGHTHARKFIIKNLNKYGWKVELDEFVGSTPIGRKKFTNIIATWKPELNRRLALVAHYDSKLIPARNGKEFIGATDSAVSCAMLLHFAKLFKDKCEGAKMKVDVSPMLIFTDGEEAFVKWSRNDSLYGSRHLAAKWENQAHHNKTFADRGATMLTSLDAFILFDLIGTNQGQFVNMFYQTYDLYDRMKHIETNLITMGKIKSLRHSSRRDSYFRGKQVYFVEDDHLPFYMRHVPILHLISLPFPTQWHQVTDNKDALDPDTIVDLLKIFDQFLLEYFHVV